LPQTQSYTEVLPRSSLSPHPQNRPRSQRAVDFSTEFQENDTPLSVAERWGNTHIVDFLLQLTAESSADLPEKKKKKKRFLSQKDYIHTFSCDWRENESVFSIKKHQNLYRKFTISVFHATPHTPTDLHPLIGRAVFSLNLLHPRRQLVAPLSNPDGQIGEVMMNVEYHTLSHPTIERIEFDYTAIDALEAIKRLKKHTAQKNARKTFGVCGYLPRFPIVIIPGMASSALEVYQTKEKEWKHERVWIDPLKIGRLAMFEKVTKVFQKENVSSSDDGPIDAVCDAEKRRKWIDHMTLAADGVSDPPGIKVRPVEGLHAIDYLATWSMAKAPSYVFAHLIDTLTSVGYDLSSLAACPYDWRLPPQKLHERDHYFCSLQKRIEVLYEYKEQRVVLLAHSMGNRVVQYFFQWLLHRNQQKWIDTHIHAFLAMGPPFLGSSKAIRTVLCGDGMGLEMFLTKDESLYMARASASLPWLFPILTDHYPDHIIRTNSDTVSFTPTSYHTTLQSYVPKSLKYYEEYYLLNPFYMKTTANHLAPVLQPPPVERIWVVNGVNRPTEVGYFLRSKRSEPQIDTSADKFSGKKSAFVNPRGLLINEGIAYETSETYQPSSNEVKSGDGTVPYCSSNYAEVAWGEHCHVYSIEIEEAEHREMLNNDAVFWEIIKLVCTRDVALSLNEREGPLE
jgi:hypothetical protein